MNLFWRLRMMIMRAQLALTRPMVRIGQRAKIGVGASFSSNREVRIGDDFFCGRDCHFGAPTDIGRDVMFASFVALVGGDHRIDGISVPIRLSGRETMKTIHICDDVWIGHGATVLHGCRLGTGSVVAAGAVVTKDVPDYAIVAGNPARVLRHRERTAS